MNQTTQTMRCAAILLGAALAGALLPSCSSDDSGGPAASPHPAPAVAVQVTQPATRNVSRLISLPGEVRPWEEATLYSKVPGTLKEITVDKGDRVAAGQLVATIEAPELDADREQALASYRSSLAAATGSRAAADRAAAERQRARAAAERSRADLAESPAETARAKALAAQALAAVHQAEDQKRQAGAAMDEGQAQVDRAVAELDSARSEQSLAQLTYARYQGIYNKNPMLIARQDVDVAESRAKAAAGKSAAALSALEAAQRHIKVLQAQDNIAASQIEQARAAASAAQEQVSFVGAQQEAAKKQVGVADQDVAIASRQQAVTRAKTEESSYQAHAGRSALGKMSSLAEYARLRAPFDGVVTKRFVDRGAFIQSASASQNAAPIVTVANLNRVRLYLAVPETQARFVETGSEATITSAGLPGAALKGRVARTSASLDPKTRTLLAEIDLPNRGGKILAGTYATARIVMETHPGVLSVPTPAVGVEKAGKFVFVVEGGKAKRIPVTTGFDDGAYTEITTGLRGGETVVVTGRDNLTPNAPVAATQLPSRH
jgi:RND family efflux transporter MFP subunit